MKRLFILFLAIYFISSVVYSEPYYDKNNITVEYDPAYNVALRQKLEDEYWKRHYVDEETINGGPEAYYNEVLEPYILKSKNMKDLPQRKFRIEDEKLK